jgi:GNAT superfamily N-acetyltransferase
MISYTDTIAGIGATQLQGFFVGWPNPPSPETHLRILADSYASLLARDDETGAIVGFITAISDGVSCAYIPHLEVLPAYQGRGIGSELMRRMLERLRHIYVNNCQLQQEACIQSQRGGRHNRLVDGSPGNVHGSVYVGVCGIATFLTQEPLLRLAICFLTMPTHATGAACVARVYQNHAHALALCLVAEKQPQLVEGPTRALPSLRPSNRCSLPNSLEVFERECLTVVFGLPHKALAHFVVDLTLKACLFAGKLTQAPARTAGVGFLEPLAVLKASFAYLSDLCAAVLLTLRVSRKVDQAEINTDNADWFVWCGGIFGLGNVEIPHIRTADQFRAANLPGLVIQGAALEITQHKLPNYPTAQGIERHPIQAEKAVGACIVADAAIVTERRTISLAVLPSAAHRLGRLVSGAARQLCAKTVVGATWPIDKVVELVLVGDALLPRDRGAIGCRAVERLLSLAQRRISRSVKSDFTAYGTRGEGITHKGTISQENVCVNGLHPNADAVGAAVLAFLCRRKSAVFCEVFDDRQSGAQ